MGYKSTQEVFESLSGIAEIGPGTVRVIDEAGVRDKLLDKLVFNAAFNKKAEFKGLVKWLIRTIAQELGARSASIQGLYEAMGRGEVSGFTVAAINIRGLSYDVARAVIRAAKKNNSGTFIFDIATSETNYSGHAPDEYAVV